MDCLPQFPLFFSYFCSFFPSPVLFVSSSHFQIFYSTASWFSAVSLVILLLSLASGLFLILLFLPGRFRHILLVDICWTPWPAPRIFALSYVTNFDICRAYFLALCCLLLFNCNSCLLEDNCRANCNNGPPSQKKNKTNNDEDKASKRLAKLSTPGMECQ